MAALTRRSGWFVDRYGPWAVVTGASSGIGAEFARQLAGRGLSVAVVARRRDRLDALAAELRDAHRVAVQVIDRDLTAPGAVAAVADAVADLDVGLLVNNAGFGLKGRFLDHDLDELQRMVTLNCWVPVALTRTLGPRLAARDRAALVMVASTAAFQGLPGSTVYGASKGFDLLLGEGLWAELGGDGVDVVTVAPGGTDTEGPRRTGVDPARVPGKLMAPSRVVAAALAGLGRRALVVPGAGNRVAAWLTRAVPRRVATRVAGRMMRRVMGGG